MSGSPLARPDVWNAVAEGYTIDLAPLFALYARDAVALASPLAGFHVLDVAAGPGTLALLAARQARRVTAVDFADTMVGILRRRIGEEGLANVEVLQADGQALPFADAAFDAAFSMFGLIFFPDRGAGFRELRRVVRPGGVAVVASWAPFDDVPLIRTLFEALGEFLPDLPFGDGRAPLGEPEAFCAEMEEARFTSVDIVSRVHETEVPSAQAFWAANARSSAPLAVLRQHLGPAEFEALGRRLVARIEERLGPGPYTMRWTALLGRGIA